MAQDPNSVIPNVFGAYLQPPTYQSTAPQPLSGYAGALGKISMLADSFLSGVSRGRAIAAAREAQKQDALYKGIYQTIVQVQNSDAAPPVKDQALRQLSALQAQVLQDALGGGEKGNKRSKSGQNQGQDQNHPGFHISNAVRGIVNAIAGPGAGQPVDANKVIGTLNAVRAAVFDPNNSEQAFMQKVDIPIQQAYAKAVQDNGGKPPTWSFLTAQPYFMNAYAATLSQTGGKITPALSAIMSSSQELQKEQASLEQRKATAAAEDAREQKRSDAEDRRTQERLKTEQEIAAKREEEETKRAESRDRAMEMRMRGAGGGTSLNESDTDAIVSRIEQGLDSPMSTGMYRNWAKIRAKLDRDGYPIATAQQDWLATQAHLKTLNGAQMTRVMTALNSLDAMIPQLQEAYDKWQATGLPSGYKAYNKAALIAAAQGSGKSSAIAQNLLTLINDTTAEMSYVYMGSTSPTDHALKLAEENIKGNWNAETFNSSLDLLKKNIQIRRNSIMTSPVLGISQNSPYIPKPAQGGTPPPPGGQQAQGGTPPPPGKSSLPPDVQSLVNDYQQQ